MNMNLDLSFLADQPSFVNGERANSPAMAQWRILRFGLNTPQKPVYPKLCSPTCSLECRCSVPNGS